MMGQKQGTQKVIISNLTGHAAELAARLPGFEAAHPGLLKTPPASTGKASAPTQAPAPAPSPTAAGGVIFSNLTGHAAELAARLPAFAAAHPGLLKPPTTVPATGGGTIDIKS